MDLSIKRIETIDDFEKVYQLDLKVWGTEPVPVHQILTAAKNGGIVLGSFLEERLVGFVTALLGLKTVKFIFVPIRWALIQNTEITESALN